MPKQDFIVSKKQEMVLAQDAILDKVMGEVWDQGAMEQKASDGTLTQGDLDKAVAAAVDPLNKQISDLTAKDAADVAALGEAQGKLLELQKKFEDLSGKEAQEAAMIAGLQNAKQALEDIVQKLNSIFAQPAPTPQPQPTPAPAQ